MSVTRGEHFLKLLWRFPLVQTTCSPHTPVHVQYITKYFNINFEVFFLLREHTKKALFELFSTVFISFHIFLSRS
jgi:hypothetical protein